MLLQVDKIHKSYPIPKGIFSKGRQAVVRGVSFDLAQGECLGLVGESGSGKSTLGRMILGIDKADAGRVLFEGQPVDRCDTGIKSVVFQDYISSVNPRFKVIQIIEEPLVGDRLSKEELEVKAVELLEKVGLDRTYLYRYPHQLSGGQCQRVCIARAIATNPKFILLDEAISSLDVSVQMQVMDLLKELKETMNLSYLFITHDLLAVTYICDRVLFFKEGRVVESVNRIADLKGVKHDYAKSLLLNL